jgi:FKBP-type peptidyl-prolyl cis-trans isomerase SlyD
MDVSQRIAKNKVVSVAYTLRNAAGETLDEGTAEEPLLYLHGHENLLPAVESQLDGKTVGDKAEFTVSAAEGYGEREPDAFQKIERVHLPKTFTPEAGMEIVADFGEGPRPFTITAVTKDDITIDLNHPLAGVDLHFSFEVLEVRDAHEMELAHGHVHAHGNHHH